MKHAIIGTAGHVDHGKTALVKALTGIDTDRLEEEKRRGVTIELGFAYLDFDDGTRAGIVDVPGHERFIRNMLAGAGGIDFALLVVDAEESVMPQTREHLGILEQLGITNGLVAVTKIDKADSEWLTLVMDDIAQLVEGTFLEGKALIPVSAFTGEGLQDLKRALYEMVCKTDDKETHLPFRLPVDRVFPIDGFGTVVTGTLIEGSVCVGDMAEILPSGEKAPVRNIQVHGENTEKAYAGQRTAISLAGVKRGSINRGDVLSKAGFLNVTEAVDVKLTIISDTKRVIKTGDELHMYHGARTLLAKAILLDCGELHSGESCYARLKLREPLPCKRGDRFVLRFYSPLETIGGGVILDSLPEKRLPRTKEALDTLGIRENGSAKDIAGLAATQLGTVFTEAELCRRADLDEKTCVEAVATLTTDGSIIGLPADKGVSSGKYISTAVLKILSEKCKKLLGDYHKEFPLRVGMNIAELRQKLTPDNDISEANAVISLLSNDGATDLSERYASLPEFSVTLTPVQSKIHGKLLETLATAVYDTPSPDELASLFTKNEKAEFDRVFEHMLTNGELVMFSPQVFWLSSVFEKALGSLYSFFETNEEITLAQCRDLLGTTRKYALAFLEYLDAKQITRLESDSRKLTPEPSRLRS